MMKRIFSGLVVSFVLFFFWSTLFFHSPTLSQSKGYWSRTETKLVSKDRNDPPFFISKKGKEGQLQTICRYEEENRKELAITDWSWNTPPKALIAGNTWKVKLSGVLQQWTTTEYLAGSLIMRIQEFGASCCDLTGIDLGFLHLDGNADDKINLSKTSVKTGKIPLFGDLQSKKTEKLQILTNLSLNGANYQWITMYQWVNQPSLTTVMRIDSDIAYINQEKIVLPGKPLLLSNKTFLPIRMFSDLFGCYLEPTIDKNSKLLKEIVLETDNIHLLFKINTQECYRNGVLFQEQVPIYIVAGRTYIPARTLATLLNQSIVWNQQKKEISLSKFW